MYWKFFFRFIVEKKSTPKRKKLFYSIISQWSCWMQPIKKQSKHCQTSLKKNSSSNSFNSLTKTWNSRFECHSIKIYRNQNLFFLILLFLPWKCKRSNSQSISYWNFCYSSLVHQVFPAKIKFSLLFFPTSENIFFFQKNYFPCSWKNFWDGL